MNFNSWIAKLGYMNYIVAVVTFGFLHDAVGHLPTIGHLCHYHSTSWERVVLLIHQSRGTEKWEKLYLFKFPMIHFFAPKFCINFCSQIIQGGLHIPRAFENYNLCKIWEEGRANRLYYGELEKSQLNIWGRVAVTVVVWLLMTLLMTNGFLSVAVNTG